MENQERNGFGRTENQQKDFEKRVSAVIENLKGITRSEARNILNRAEYFLENDSILNYKKTLASNISSESGKSMLFSLVQFSKE